MIKLSEKPNIWAPAEEGAATSTAAGSTTDVAPSKAGRLQQLDLLRALAIGLVLIRHMSLYKCSSRSILGLVQETLFRGGWVGVDLFFVLSGFLVSGLLFREYQKYETISFKQFFARRGFKIYPPYWVMLAIGAVVLSAFGRSKNLTDYLYSLFFLQNYGPHIWAPTWSLAVEEHFYIILPAMLCALAWWRKRTATDLINPFRQIPLIFFATTTICSLLRIYHAQHFSFSQEGSVFPTHLRIDSLMFGVMLSYFHCFHSTAFSGFITRHKTLLAIGGSMLLVPAFIYDQAHNSGVYTFGYNAFYLGSGMLLLAALTCSRSNSRLLTTIAAIGTASYSIYLWHPIVNLFAVQLLFDNSAIAWICYLSIYFIGSIVFGIFMTRVIECPMLILRDRLIPSRSRAI